MSDKTDLVFWSCATDTPLGHLSRARGIPETFCVELSAHDWDDEARVFDELARAFSFPEASGRHWDAVRAGLSGLRDSRPQFMAVIRDIPESAAARENVARAAETIGAEDPEGRAHDVVLDGWESATIDVRWPSSSRVREVRRLDPA